MHIKSLDIRAVLSALAASQNRTLGHLLELMTCYSPVVFYLNKQGRMISPSLCQMTQEIFPWEELHTVEVIVQYIHGRKNTVMDHLNLQDQVILTDWSLPQMFHKRSQVYRRPMVGLFISPVVDPMASKEDTI